MASEKGRYQPLRDHPGQSSFSDDNDGAGIEAGHGDVLLTPAEAAALGLPPSFPHPFRPEFSVYIIDAYHAMHCLKVLRDHCMRMYHAHRYLSDWPLEHDVHCFDSLRQHVMCHADDTLLCSTGHHDVGVQQTKTVPELGRAAGLGKWAECAVEGLHQPEAPRGISDSSLRASRTTNGRRPMIEGRGARMETELVCVLAMQVPSTSLT
ncbi:hypothetical protein VM1G_11848 [Cytospora mali]|uniref:Uncharacterized protein n=1 Tax=Cytospora mali TaxID=578113 RepID=A0A194WAC1_CYTMA|nr:hypothetical protein VM1G_11848 [Valsa mali]